MLGREDCPNTLGPAPVTAGTLPEHQQVFVGKPGEGPASTHCGSTDASVVVRRDSRGKPVHQQMIVFASTDLDHAR